jgi:hypothetical protein
MGRKKINVGWVRLSEQQEPMFSNQPEEEKKLNPDYIQGPFTEKKNFSQIMNGCN